MGSVYLARDPDLEYEVAIKVMREGFESDEARQRFLREARAIAQLHKHRNIVKVHHFDVTADGRPYMVMEHIQGETLQQMIQRRAPLRPEEKLSLLEQLCAGMAFAHRQTPPVIHRDIKPANLIFDSHDGTLKIVDFGIARQGLATLTEAPPNFMGTLPYMSPEQVHGQPIDQRCDQFSAGIVAYELLTYTEAFKRGPDDHFTDLYRRRFSNERPIPLREIAPDLDAGVVQIVERMLQLNRDDRYQNLDIAARALAEARRRIEVGQTIPIPLPPPPVPPPPPPPRPSWIPVTAAAGVLLAAIVIAFFWPARHPPPNPPIEIPPPIVIARRLAEASKQEAVKAGATASLKTYADAEGADKEGERLAARNDLASVERFNVARGLYDKSAAEVNFLRRAGAALKRVEAAKQRAMAAGAAATSSAHFKQATALETKADEARQQLREEAIDLYYEVANEYDASVPPLGPDPPPGPPALLSPAAGSTLTAPELLTWSATGATTFDVYFGTKNPPPPVSRNQAKPEYRPATLEPGSQDYWRVDARNKQLVTRGPVWSFSMTPQPLPPTPPGVPATTLVDGATVDTNQTLTWTAQGATVYDVYFGTKRPPTRVTSDQTAASFKPALEPGTQYFWRIDARNSAGTTTGTVWSFSVRAVWPPSNPALRDTTVNPKDGLKMVYIPPASFTMGSPANEQDRNSDEGQFDTSLPRGLWIDQTEVTRQAFKRYVDAKGGDPGKADLSGDPQLPVTQVSWYTAQAYCAWAMGRLPTEREWEYAARANSKRRYWWGSDRFNPADANDGDAVLPAGGSRKNLFDLYDMLGNVWEWTSTLYKPYPYDPADGREDASASGPRVVRGGAFNQNEKFLRISSRIQVQPGMESEFGGFRCAR